MILSDITPVVLTYNETPNLSRTLDGLRWATEVVVLDSHSTDGTLDIARSYPNVRIAQRIFDNHTDQWNYGIEQVQTPWCLSLDADYVCTGSFVDELKHLEPDAEVLFAGFAYCVYGVPLRGTLYPPRAVLFRADRYRYVQDGHTQVLRVAGKSGALKAKLLHDDRKSMTRWATSQIRYAALECDKLAMADSKSLGWKDKVRSYLLLAPLLTIVYCLFYKRLLFDGWRGWFYTLQRVFAELLLSLMLLEKKLRRGDPEG